MNHISKKIPSFNGFTLVELIVVITILAILGTIGFISIQGYSEDAKDSTKITDLTIINTAIGTAIVWEKWFGLAGLQPILYNNYPQDTTVWVGELLWKNIPGLNNPPLDPFTKKPYVIGIYRWTDDGLTRYVQVGSVLENKKWNTPLAIAKEAYASTLYAPSGVPMQKVVWNYIPGKAPGISGFIPRWALENYQDFKKTEFYGSGAKMYGATWGSNNNYIFAMDGLPLVQVTGYTNTGTLLYESFENLKAEVIMATGFQATSFKNYPHCFSNSVSTALSFEWNATYGDQIQTTACSVDTGNWANSQSSLYLKWLRDSAGWDGQYTYLMINPNKKYQYSLDVKWHLASTVSGWKLNLNFYCYKKNSLWTATNVGAAGFLVTLDPANFTRISAYVNAPDPSGNGLSITLPGGITDATACIFYRANAPKGGDELWFDNHIVKEIP